MAAFLKGTEVMGVDLDVPRETLPNRTFTRASITELPFADSSFPYVSCIDVLQDLPLDVREQGLTEMLRVARDGVVITAPQGEVAERLDADFEHALRRRGATVPPWVGVSRANPYPTVEAVVAAIRRADPSTAISVSYGEPERVSRLVRAAAVRSTALYAVANLAFGLLVRATASPLPRMPTACSSWRGRTPRLTPRYLVNLYERTIRASLLPVVRGDDGIPPVPGVSGKLRGRARQRARLRHSGVLPLRDALHHTASRGGRSQGLRILLRRGQGRRGASISCWAGSRRRCPRWRAYRSSLNRWLDIGCGAGTLLQAVVNGGWEAIGTEVAPAAVDALRTAGFEALLAETGELDLPPESFDVVSMVEVIEHVPSPDGLLADAARLLRPGGALYLTTPHGRGLSPRVLRARWSLVTPPDHLQLFSLAGLRAALARAGLTVRSVATHGLNPHELVAGLRPGRERRSARCNTETSYRLNESLSTKRTGAIMKRAANAALSTARLGDTVKLVAERPTL